MASSCPGNPPPHAGYVYWTGPVPPVLTTWAVYLLDHSSKIPYGTEWTKPYDGQEIIARHDRHTWTFRGGRIVYGCYSGITLYRPRKLADEGTVIDPNDPASGVAQFTDAGTDWVMVGITGGFIVGVSLLFAWGIKKAGRH